MIVVFSWQPLGAYSTFVTFLKKSTILCNESGFDFSFKDFFTFFIFFLSFRLKISADVQNSCISWVVHVKHFLMKFFNLTRQSIQCILLHLPDTRHKIKVSHLSYLLKKWFFGKNKDTFVIPIRKTDTTIVPLFFQKIICWRDIRDVRFWFLVLCLVDAHDRNPTVHNGYSYYRGGGGIPICHQLWTSKIFFIKNIKFDFSLLQIIYILTQALEITVKYCGSFGTCAQNPKKSFISTVNWMKKGHFETKFPENFFIWKSSNSTFFHFKVSMFWPCIQK